MMSKRNLLSGQLLLALFLLLLALAPGQAGAETPGRVCLNGQCYTVKTTGRICVNGACSAAKVVKPAKPIQTPLPPAEPAAQPATSNKAAQPATSNKAAQPASSAAQPAQSVTANKPIQTPLPPAEPVVKPTRTPMPRLEPPPTPTKVTSGKSWCPPGPSTENVRCLDRTQAQADRATTSK